MHKLLIIFVLFFIVMFEVSAYSVRVYDEYGNRVGTYKKEGDRYQFYDFNDNKVDRPEAIIKDAPTDRTLTEYSQTFYDENMMPIGTWRSGLYGNDGRYYPRGYFYPTAFYRTHTPQIVRPSANNKFNTPTLPHQNMRPQSNTYFEDTRFPKFHNQK